MKPIAFTVALLLAAFAHAQTSQPIVREHPGAKDAIAGDQSLYLFVRYEGGRVGEMIFANVPATSVERDGQRLKVVIKSPTGATLSFGGNRGLTMLRILPDGRVRQTMNRLPALPDDPVSAFEKATKETGQDLPAYLATRAEFGPLLEFMTGPVVDKPAEPRPPREPRDAASTRPTRTPEPEIVEALRGRNPLRVQAAIDQKPDLTVTNRWGEPLVYQAVQAGDVDVVILLIKAGADVNARTKRGDTPLSHAVDRNDTGLARALLENGADPNLAKSNGWTPLTVAAHERRLQMTKLLLAFKADPTQKDGQGKTPLDRATGQSKNDDVVNAIREAMGGKVMEK